MVNSKPMDYVVTKYTMGKADELHFIRMPDPHEKGWYVTGISVSAFKHRMQKRYVKIIRLPDGGVAAQGRSVDFRFHVQMRCDWDDHEEVMKACGVKKQLAEFHHDSLWAFYEHIGYDFKRNKLKVEPVVLK